MSTHKKTKAEVLKLINDEISAIETKQLDGQLLTSFEIKKLDEYKTSLRFVNMVEAVSDDE